MVVTEDINWTHYPEHDVYDFMTGFTVGTEDFYQGMQSPWNVQSGRIHNSNPDMAKVTPYHPIRKDINLGTASERALVARIFTELITHLEPQGMDRTYEETCQDVIESAQGSDQPNLERAVNRFLLQVSQTI